MEMDFRRLFLFISSLSVTSITQCHCACPSCETIHFNVNQNVMPNFAMVGKQIDSEEHVPSVFACFVRCQKNCLCESFNYWHSQMSGGRCELNEGDVHGASSSIKPTNGSLFYNFHRQISPGCPDCSSRLSCCASSNPCYNGVCTDSCRQLGRRYECKCPPRYSGTRCEHLTNNS